jgi:hypothetical protein
VRPARSGVGKGEASGLAGIAVALDRVRADRILHEALAAVAAPLHLLLVFNLDATTATRYAATTRRILTRPKARNPLRSPRWNHRTSWVRPALLSEILNPRGNW